MAIMPIAPPPRLIAIVVVGGGLSLACDSAAPGPEPEPTTDDPRAAVLRINELVASNATVCPDAVGEFDDWVELVNLGNDDVPLDGVTITDDRGARDKAPLDGLVLPAGGTLLLFADGTVTQGTNHLPFKLSAAGEEVLLCIDGAIVDEVTWTNALPDEGLARFPDGTGAFTPCATTTCGANNGAGCGS
jgi:hypothetical protein